MKLKKSSLMILIVLSLISLLALIGCPSPQQRPAPAPAPAPDLAPTPNVTPGPGPAQSDQIPDLTGMDPGPIEGGMGNRNGNGAQEARRLSTMINVLPEVNSSSVILSRNTAVVGLDLKANLNTQRVNALKAEVSRRVKRANNRITKVTVTADADTVTRIQGVADGLRQGRPLTSFDEEMSDIMQRLTPTNR